jgi:hypothetical protein
MYPCPVPPPPPKHTRDALLCKTYMIALIPVSCCAAGMTVAMASWGRYLRVNRRRRPLGLAARVVTAQLNCSICNTGRQAAQHVQHHVRAIYRLSTSIWCCRLSKIILGLPP